MRLLFLIFALTFLSFNHGYSQTSEYVTVRVQYGANLSGLRYKLYLDIGTSGDHSMSGYVTNMDDKVIISTDRGKYEFTSDIDLLNYLAKQGWKVIQLGEVQILDQHYYTYLLEKITP